jgi:hypothetical protein
MSTTEIPLSRQQGSYTSLRTSQTAGSMLVCCTVIETS